MPRSSGVAARVMGNAMFLLVELYTRVFNHCLIASPPRRCGGWPKATGLRCVLGPFSACVWTAGRSADGSCTYGSDRKKFGAAEWCRRAGEKSSRTVSERSAVSSMPATNTAAAKSVHSAASQQRDDAGENGDAYTCAYYTGGMSPHLALPCPRLGYPISSDALRVEARQIAIIMMIRMIF